MIWAFVEDFNLKQKEFPVKFAIRWACLLSIDWIFSLYPASLRLMSCR